MAILARVTFSESGPVDKAGRPWKLTNTSLTEITDENIKQQQFIFDSTLGRYCFSNTMNRNIVACQEAQVAGFDRGSGDFSAGLWLYMTTLSPFNSAIGFFTSANSDGNSWATSFLHTTTSSFMFEFDNQRLSLARKPAINTWTHFLFSRKGNALRFWENGTRIGDELSVASGTTWNMSTHPLAIGVSGYNGNLSYDYFPYAKFDDFVYADAACPFWDSGFSVEGYPLVSNLFSPVKKIYVVRGE
jgi:hypothetical protein